jgi:hypothetical protein
MQPEKKPKKPAQPAEKPKPADGEKPIDDRRDGSASRSVDPKRAEPKPPPRRPFISEGRMDREDEDSFPASDPPSYTPTLPK